MTRLSVVTLFVLGIGCAACSSQSVPEAARNLPAGDPDMGRQAFIDLKCAACHEVAGASLPTPSVLPAVALGGKTLLPPSNERLAQDILLPSSHFAVGYPIDQIVDKDKSRMPDYSKVLTKDQVANLVAFLKARYEMGLPSPTR